MGQFHAWAAVGQVTKLDVWSDAGESTAAAGMADGQATMRIATRLTEQQKFVLRPRDGREIPVLLIDSGIALQNGHIATLVWAAGAGSAQEYCIYVQNHTTGARVRLSHSLRLLRPQVELRKIARLGLLATLPAALAILTWLVVPGSLAEVDFTIFLVSAAIALVVLFGIGATVSKLVFDYMRSEDDDKIWKAASQAVVAAHQAERTIAHQRVRV
jgi:hypothetical protein